MKFEIKARFTGKVLFTAELSTEFDESENIKLGAAVKLAVIAGANLAGADLAGADLARADLAGANLAGADLAGANLAGADLAGANLAGANLAGAYLAGADLAGANLAGANLAGADLAGAYLADADLARANLAGAYLACADLAGADLADANLAGASLAGANLAGASLADAKKIEEKDIPVITNIDAAILAAIETGGTLDMSAWHGPAGWCGTTHCRAGWAVHLAGAPGKALEDRVGTQMAAVLIYRASRPGEAAPWFFAPQDKAMADIKACAARQLGSAA